MKYRKGERVKRLSTQEEMVEAALRRIERAHSQPAGHAVASTAVAYDQQPDFELNLTPAEELSPVIAKPERVHNLAVVPTPAAITTNIQRETRKPRRLIDDQNDPALNYLDSIPTSLMVETREYHSAPFYLRILGGLADLLFVCILSFPFLALTQLTNLEWRNPRVIGFAAATFVIVGFLYLTVSIAFTGRTLGMKLFFLRVVDARTGLIPTGSQSYCPRSFHAHGCNSRVISFHSWNWLCSAARAGPFCLKRERFVQFRAPVANQKAARRAPGNIKRGCRRSGYIVAGPFSGKDLSAVRTLVGA